MVVVGDINPPAISPANLDFFRTDVTSWDDLSGLFKKAKGLHGSIDHVFANAGISGRANYLESVEDEDGELEEPSHLTFDVNLRGMINTCYLAFHYLRNKDPPGGTVVCTASASSFQHFRVADYTTAKHGVLGFMRGMVPNIVDAKLPIRINCISPSWTRTGLVPDELIKATGMPIQEPEDVARVVALLMADDDRQGQLIYSVKAKHYEVEHSILLPAAKEIIGDEDWGSEDAIIREVFKHRGRLEIPPDNSTGNPIQADVENP